MIGEARGVPAADGLKVGQTETTISDRMAKRRRIRTRIGIVAAIAGAVYLLLIFRSAYGVMTTFQAAQAKARAILARSDMRVIQGDMLMYSFDNDERLPPAENYHKAIHRYVKSDLDPFRSLLDPPGTISYRMNPLLGSKHLDDLEEPSHTVLLFEGEWGNPPFRYRDNPGDKLAVIGFADGTAQLLDTEGLKSVRWEAVFKNKSKKTVTAAAH